MDLFKAIFENSEPSSSSSSSEDSGDEDKHERDAVCQPAEGLKSVIDNTRMDTASDATAAAVAHTAELAPQHATQQQDSGMMIYQ